MIITDNENNYFNEYEIAMAYVPIQKNIDTYSLQEGYKAGTIFPVLDKPLTVGGRI